MWPMLARRTFLSASLAAATARTYPTTSGAQLTITRGVSLCATADALFSAAYWFATTSGVLLSLPRHNEINPTAICSFLWFIIRLSGVLLLKPVYVITDSLFKYMVYCIVYCLWFMIIVVYGLYVCLISVVEWARMSMWCFCRSIIGSLFLILDGVIGWIIYITLVAVSSMILRGRSATATRIARHLVTKSFARK